MSKVSKRPALSLDSLVYTCVKYHLYLPFLLLLCAVLPSIIPKLTLIFILLCRSGLSFNTWYKRKGAWEKLGSSDLALITGGSSGLGLEITKLLIEKNVKVIILDIVEPPKAIVERGNLASFFKCDLKDKKLLEETIKSIKLNFGIPTILINNAAIRHDEKLADLKYEKIEQIFQVNLMSQIILLQTFLSEIRDDSRFYVVTVASVLGLVSPSHLSIYSATKAALISVHDSISHEFYQSNIRFLLVNPGQINTTLFCDVKPPKQFLAPLLTAGDLAKDIVRKIEVGERGILSRPLYTNFIPILRMLPFCVSEACRDFSEMDTTLGK